MNVSEIVNATMPKPRAPRIFGPGAKRQAQRIAEMVGATGMRPILPPSRQTKRREGRLMAKRYAKVTAKADHKAFLAEYRAERRRAFA